MLLVAVAMIASTFGGYITGRLRHSWEDVHVHERFFRDTAHGFVAWAVTCDELRLVFLTPLWTRTAHVVLLRMVRGRFPKLRYG